MREHGCNLNSRAGIACTGLAVGGGKFSRGRELQGGVGGGEHVHEDRLPRIVKRKSPDALRR
jgi:hypothetical protein